VKVKWAGTLTGFPPPQPSSKWRGRTSNRLT
jgi:hypothetical protein